MSDTPYIVGEVLTTFFENPQNFYKVMLVRVIESDCVDVDDEIVVTGIFGQIHSDISYRFYHYLPIELQSGEIPIKNTLYMIRYFFNICF